MSVLAAPLEGMVEAPVQVSRPMPEQHAATS